MSAATPLPSLFGRFTAIFKDHEHLASSLRRLRLMCAALEDGQVSLPAALAPHLLLEELRADLVAHFAAEESPEYFGTVLEEEPSLAREIAALKWEHLMMLRGLDLLSELVKDSSRWLHLPAPTRELIRQLERHEGAETKLLRNLFRLTP